MSKNLIEVKGRWTENGKLHTRAAALKGRELLSPFCIRWKANANAVMEEVNHALEEQGVLFEFVFVNDTSDQLNFALIKREKEERRKFADGDKVRFQPFELEEGDKQLIGSVGTVKRNRRSWSRRHIKY